MHCVPSPLDMRKWLCLAPAPKELVVLRGRNVVGEHQTSRVKLGLNGNLTENLHYFIKATGCFVLLMIDIMSFSE